MGWGSKKHLSIETVQKFENFASAYLDNQTGYDVQNWNFSYVATQRTTTYSVARATAKNVV